MKNRFFSKKNKLFTNSFYLYLSDFSDYLLAIIFLPFIVGVLGPEAFGRIGLAQSFSILIILFLEFGFSLMAIREVARKKDNNNQIKIFLGKTVTFKLILVPIAVFLSFPIVIIMPISLELSLIAFSGAVFQGLSPSWYFYGIENMKKIALSKIIFRSLCFLLIFLFIDSPDDGWIVLLSYSLSSLLICLFLFVEIFKKVGKFSLAHPLKTMEIFKKSKFSFFVTILPIIYQNANMIFMSLILNPVQLGLFYGVRRIYTAFNTLFGPIGQAFYPKLSALSMTNKQSEKKLILKLLLLMIMIGFFFFGLIALLSKEMILILLGKEFLSADTTLKLFGLVLPLTAISHVLGRQWAMIRNEENYLFIAQLISSLLGFTVFIILFENLGILSFPISLIVYELSSIIMLIIFILRKKWIILDL